MNATTIKSFLAKLTLILVVSSASAEDLVGTRIDVQGSVYSDQMWMFSVPICTRDFDNGWDGFKMVGTTVAPQIFAIEPSGNYQVDAVADVNNTYIGFIAGVDSVYTMTFTHQNLNLGYQHLYLVDSIANKTVDVYADGTKYTFTAVNKITVKRFKIVTSIPQTVTIPQIPTDTVATATTVTNDTIAPDTTTVTSGTTPAPEVSSTSTAGSPDQPSITTTEDADGLDKSFSSKKLRIYTAHKTIIIENRGKSRGKLSLYNAMSGRLVKNVEFYANGTTTIPTDEPAGTYVLRGLTQNDEIAKTVMIY